MAGGSRIEISNDGITISTGGKIIYKAGQHKFEGGEKVVSPKISLPLFNTLYSNQVDYCWAANIGNTKEIFVLDAKNNSLIKTNLDNLDEKKIISSLRFYTSEPMDFIALGFNSTSVSMNQKKYDEQNINELLKEIDMEHISDSDIGEF